jgi:hypothetical protein
MAGSPRCPYCNTLLQDDWCRKCGEEIPYLLQNKPRRDDYDDTDDTDQAYHEAFMDAFLDDLDW